MSDKKEGWRERFGSWISGRKGEISTEEALSQTGIDLIKTNNLEKRIDQFEDFTQYIEDTVGMKDENGKSIERTPEQEVTFLAERANGIIGKLHKASIPWGTGGETGYYTTATFGWSVIYVITLTFIQGVQFLLKQDKIYKKTSVKNKTEKKLKDTSKIDGITTLVYTRRTFGIHDIDITSLVDTLKYFYFKYYIQYALKVSYISWFGRDIVPTKVAMVSNIPEQRRLGISLSELEGIQNSRDNENNE